MTISSSDSEEHDTNSCSVEVAASLLDVECAGGVRHPKLDDASLVAGAI